MYNSERRNKIDVQAYFSHYHLITNFEVTKRLKSNIPFHTLNKI